MGDEKGLLTLKELDDKKYWYDKYHGVRDIEAILKAQQALTRQENETKAQLDRLDADQKGYVAGLKRGREMQKLISTGLEANNGGNTKG